MNSYYRGMTETARILQAAATMDEFTVADLVSVCDASPLTVRTVLARKPNLLEELGREETGRPGGKWKRYRLTPQARKELAPAFQDPEADSPVPADLVAVEEMLLSREAIEADSRMRESLVRRAQRRLRRAADEASAGGAAARAHRHVVMALIALLEGEGIEDPEALTRARMEAEEARRLLPLERELLTALDERISLSPLRDLAPALSRTPALAAQSKQSALEGVVGVVGKILGTSLPGVPDPIPMGRYQAPMTSYRVVPASRATGKIIVASRPTGKGIAIQARKRKHTPQLAKFYARPSAVLPKRTAGVTVPVVKYGEPNQRVTRHG